MHMANQVNCYRKHQNMSDVKLSLTDKFENMLSEYANVNHLKWDFNEISQRVISIINDPETVVNENSKKSRKYWLFTISKAKTAVDLMFIIKDISLAGNNLRVNQGRAIPKKKVGLINF